jgi:fatty-acyl-CoA synthase
LVVPVTTAGGGRLDERFERVALEHPGREAIVSGDQRLSYQELWRRSVEVANTLKAEVRPGDRVALQLRRAPELVAAMLGIWRAGGVVVPLHPRMEARELREAVAEAAPTVVLLDAGSAAATQLGGRELPLPSPGLRGLVTGHVSAGSPVGLAAVFHTSGTTGTPKGVMHTHASLLASVDGLDRLQRSWLTHSSPRHAWRFIKVLWRYRRRLAAMRRAPVWMTTLGLHSLGGSRVLLQALLRGDCLVVPSGSCPAVLAQLLERERVSILAATPATVEAMLRAGGLPRRDLSSLAVVGLGGGAASPSLVERAAMALGCPVVIGYGTAELGGGVLVTRIDDPDAVRCDSVGRAIPDVMVRVVDEARRPVPSGTVGELACRSGSLMAGYDGASSATAAVTDADGWYYTGDLATIDERGYVRIVGRKHDLIVRSGQNVYPAELECFLERHPGIDRVAVVGLPDDRRGESVCAFIVPAAGGSLTEDEVLDYCRGRLSKYKTPDVIRVVGALPTSESGEIRKDLLRQRR